MKSYFLSSTSSSGAAVTALFAVLPGQSRPWLLRDGPADADVVAYFHLIDAEGQRDHREIQADLSGRHYLRDAEVLAVLERLRARLGGEITFST